MAAKKLVKLTLDSLIAKKMEREKNEIKFKDIEIPSLEGLVTFNKPSEDMVFEVFNEIKGNEDNMEEIANSYSGLIYNCCSFFKEIFKNQEGTEKKYSVPSDVVKDFLTLSDRLTVGNELIEMTGLAGDKLKKKSKKQ